MSLNAPVSGGSASADTGKSTAATSTDGTAAGQSSDGKTEIDPREAGRALAKARHDKFVTDFKAKAGIKDPPPVEEKPPETKADPAESDHAANLANLAKATRALELARKAHEDKAKADREALEAERKKHADDTAADRARLERIKKIDELSAAGKIDEAYLAALGDEEDVPVELLQKLLERGGKAKYLSPSEVEAKFKEWYKEQREREAEEEKKQLDQSEQAKSARAEANKDMFVFGWLKDEAGPRDDMGNRQGGVAGYLSEHAAEYPEVAEELADPQRFRSEVVRLADEYYKATKGQAPDGKSGLIAQPKDILDYLEATLKEKVQKKAERMGLLKQPPKKAETTSIDPADKRGADIVAEETEEEQGIADKFLPKEERDRKRAASEKSVKDKMAARLAEIRGGRK